MDLALIAVSTAPRRLGSRGAEARLPVLTPKAGTRIPMGCTNGGGSLRAIHHGWIVMVPSRRMILHRIGHLTVPRRRNQRLRPMLAGPIFDELMKPNVATHMPTPMQRRAPGVRSSLSPDWHSSTWRRVGGSGAGGRQFRHTWMVTNTENVAPYEVGTAWSAVGSPYLMQTGDKALLVIAASEADDDRRWVVIRVHGCCGIVVGPPNDEARSGHRLYSQGLDKCASSGEVRQSRWISDLAAVHSVRPLDRPEAFSDLRHWIFKFKENTVECVGTSLSVSRETTISFPDLTSGS